jgi:uncharacterized protein
MKIFIDTSAFYALCSSSDHDHISAAECFENIVSARGILFTSNYVLLETLSLIQRRHGFEKAGEFLKILENNIEILWVGKEQHLKASRYWQAKGERNLSLVDCASFILMKEEGIEETFCFDDHFAKEGFTALP